MLGCISHDEPSILTLKTEIRPLINIDIDFIQVLKYDA
jgi:hypothetical protein